MSRRQIFMLPTKGTLPKPDAPTNLIASQNGSGQIDLVWDASLDPSVEGYYIERSDGEDGNYAQIDDVVGTTYSDTGLSSNVYFYRVRAYIGSRNSAYSNVAAAFLYVLYDEFVTPEGPPIALPRTCEPGPGTLDGTQTRTFTIASDYLQADTGGSASWSNQILNTPSQTRTYGLALGWQTYLNNSASQIMTGWSSGVATSNMVAGVWHPGVLTHWTPYATDGLFTQVPDPFVAATWYDWIVVLRGTGAFFYLRGGVYTDWQQVWVNPNNATATLYGVMSQFATAHGVRWDGVKIGKLPAPYTADANVATQLVASAVSGTTYAGVADGTFDLTMTAPNPLSTTCELRFRVQDASNYWTCYADTDGSIKVDSVVAGTPTNQLNVAGVFTAAALRIIRVRTHGSKINVYTRTSATASWTKRGSEINFNYLNGLTDVVPVAGAGWTLSALHVWNRTPASDAKLALDAFWSAVPGATYDGSGGWYVAP